MKIDRSRFLVLTGALSMAACIVEEHRPAAPPPPPPPPPAHAAATPTPAAPARNGGHNIILHAPAPPGQPAANNTPPTPVIHVPTQPSNGPTPVTPPPPAPTPSPAACLDSGAATVPPCTISCASNPFMAQRCQVYSTDFDPKVGTAAVQCMNALTGAAACDSTQAYGCGKTALNQACADNNTVAQLCQIATGPCKVAQNDCVTMISGLNSNGQDAVAQCVAKGCTSGLYSCIEGLTPNATASATHH